MRRCLLVVGIVCGVFLVASTRITAQEKKEPPPGSPFPGLEKLLPPGAIDPEEMKQLKKLL
jgi:hypothetical protein